MYRFKKAETADELEQVHRLNHSVFASELGQYEERRGGVLVDKFHDKNTYLIALVDDRVIGMISIHGEPPYSVESRLPHPDALAPFGRCAEVRQLAVEPGHRSGMVITGLFILMFQEAHAYDAIVISGIVEQAPMYHKFGFEDLGPPVASGDASYIPMAVTKANLQKSGERWRSRLTKWKMLEYFPNLREE
jgi:hypothetical protein